MKKIDFGQTINTLANIGVVVGIAFLAIEINQNSVALEEQTRMNRLTGRDAAVETFNGFRTFRLEHPDLLGVWTRGHNDEELTETEETQFRLMCENELWSRLTLHNRLRALGAEAELQGSIQNFQGGLAQSKRFQRCWDVTKRFMALQGHNEFIELVDSQ